jgi:hypothetical protein
VWAVGADGNGVEVGHALALLSPSPPRKRGFRCSCKQRSGIPAFAGMTIGG